MTHHHPSRYARARTEPTLQESAPSRQTEIEIQARLFAGEWGTLWTTTTGEEVEVVHFGEWNREAGPDFKGAAVRFGNGPVETGDIEVDTDPRDWERHGHATNPAYASVLLQLFVQNPATTAFARTFDNRAVAQARITLASPEPPPLRHPPATVDLPAALEMVAEAADHRLRTKQSAAARAAALHGPDRALFHALAAGLGFKNNAIPFLLVAQRTGLRAAAGPDGEAILFGLSGFLEPRTFDQADDVTRDYLKPLWENWWTLRDQMTRLILPPGMWKLSGIRPANHPHRRLGALATLAREFPRLRAALREGTRSSFEGFFHKLSHPYWDRHWNLSAKRLSGALSLVGADRARDLYVNAILPTRSFDAAREELDNLPGSTVSGRLRRACEWLVGGPRTELLRTARLQQGLLQLHTDFGALTALEALAKIHNTPR